jgi:hypothetical protein
MNSETIALTGPDSRQVDMPNEAGLFGYRDTRLLLVAVITAEQADVDAGGIFGREGEIHPGSVPGRAHRIRFPRQCFHGLGWTMGEAAAFARRFRIFGGK